LGRKHYDKRDDFNFSIVNFPFVYDNIPAAPAYGAYISQMIKYSRAWLLFVSLEKPLYEVCFIRIKEQVGEKMDTVCTHRYAD
jgi:hypothetical protein